MKPLSFAGALFAAMLMVAGARAEAPSSERCAASDGSGEQAAAGKVIDLNTASETELLDLPGIGPSRAKAILAYRERHGGFRSLSDLLRIKGIGRAMLKRLRPLVTVSPTSAQPLGGTGSKAGDRVR